MSVWNYAYILIDFYFAVFRFFVYPDPRGLAVNLRIWGFIYIIDIVNYKQDSLPSFRNFSKGGVAGLQYHFCAKSSLPAGVVR